MATRTPLPPAMSCESPEYASMYRESLENPGPFWGRLARSMLTWMRDFDQVMDCCMEEGRFRWFLGGQLNVSVNCLDRHDPSKVAIIWEKAEPGNHEVITYGELLKWTCQAANVLKRHGVKKGMRVVICFPCHPLVVALMLACARIGAVHCVVNFDWGTEGIIRRINIVEAHTVITAGFEGRERSAAAVVEGLQECPTVKKVFVAGINTVSGSCILLTQAMAQESTECEPEPMDSMDSLCVIFTSGTEFFSKPILHPQAGYLLATSVIFKYAFDFHPDDIFACVSSVGLIAFTTCTVYGPLATGGTTLLFGGTHTHPDPGRLWDLVQRFKLTHMAPFINYLRDLNKLGNGFVEKYDRSSLRMLTAAGSPLPESVWEWCRDVVGSSSTTIIQTWGQTECLGILWSKWEPSPQAQSRFFFNSLQPFFGVELAILEETTGKDKNITFHEVSPSDVNKPGLLCFKKPFPGLAKGVFGEQLHTMFVKNRYKRIPGYYVTEDMAYYDEDGKCKYEGREVDVINCHGKCRVASVKIESALETDGRLSAVAVVGYPSTSGVGKGVCAFVVLNSKVSVDKHELRETLKRTVEGTVGSYAVPGVILFMEALPISQTSKLARWPLDVVARFFASKLEGQQRQHVCVPRVSGAPTPISLSTPGSVSAAMAPHIGEQDALRLEQQLYGSDISIKNSEIFAKLLEDVRAFL